MPQYPGAGLDARTCQIVTACMVFPPRTRGGVRVGVDADANLSPIPSHLQRGGRKKAAYSLCKVSPRKGGVNFARITWL